MYLITETAMEFPVKYKDYRRGPEDERDYDNRCIPGYARGW
jgi:hypothetical protein